MLGRLTCTSALQTNLCPQLLADKRLFVDVSDLITVPISPNIVFPLTLPRFFELRSHLIDLLLLMLPYVTHSPTATDVTSMPTHGGGDDGNR